MAAATSQNEMMPRAPQLADGVNAAPAAQQQQQQPHMPQPPQQQQAGGQAVEAPEKDPKDKEAGSGGNKEKDGKHFISASLYVGDLTPDVEEATLHEIFNTVGPVSSIRVCRDANTHKSLGYAYVNYHTVQDAERAVDALNYAVVKGHPCRIMWSHRDPTLRRSGSGNVFVKNLDKMVDNKALYDTFSLFGTILSCKVATDEMGKSLGYGFVHYESETAAREAIAKVNGMEIGRKPVYVGPFMKRTERGDNRDEFFTNLYVKHLPNEWTEDTVRTVFQPFGTITSSAINADSRGRRFAFVNFETRESAKQAVYVLHGRRTTPQGIMSLEQEAEADARDESAAATAAAAEAETGEAGAAADTGESPTEETTANEGEAAGEDATNAGSATSQPATHQQAQQDGAVAEPEGGAALKDAATEAATPAKDKKLDTQQQQQEQQQQQSVPRSPNRGDDQSPVSPAHSLLADVPSDRLYVQRAMTRRERMCKLKDAFALAQQQQARSNDSRQYAVNLYVKNLQDDVDDEVLREAFSEYGTVTSARVMRHDTGVSRGFGFVCYAFPEDATKAVTGMHLKVFRGKPLYVGLAEKREFRSARLQQRYRMGPSRAPAAAASHAVQHQQQQQPPVPPHAVAASYPAAGPPIGYHMPPPRSTPGYPAGPPPAWRPGRPPAGFAPGSMAPPPAPGVGLLPGAAAMVPPGAGYPWNGPHAAHGARPQQQQRRNFAEGLAAAHPQMQKQMLGERLFPLVSEINKELAGKITGMMLEMDNAELLSLLENKQHLLAKVDEALAVLQRHELAQQQQQQQQQQQTAGGPF